MSKPILIFILIIISVSEIALTGSIPIVNKYLYDSLADKQLGNFYQSIIWYSLLVGFLAIEIPFKVFMVGYTSTKYRQHYTEKYTKLKDNKVPNRPGRIHDDIRICTDQAFKVGIEVFIALGCVVLLVYQALSNPYTMKVSIIYTILISLIALVFNKPMVDSQYISQTAEQEYRTDLEMNPLQYNKGLFDTVVSTFIRVIKLRSLYTLFSEFKNRALTVIVLILLYKPYMNDELSFGDLMATLSTIQLIVVNATILLIYYPEIIILISSYKRVKELR